MVKHLSGKDLMNRHQLEWGRILSTETKALRLCSKPSPLHTTTIVEKCTLKFVDDYKHMLCQATEPMSTFLEYISLNDSFIDLLPCL
ncbi:unnamed protein product [Brassica rapa subsp. narinosa]